MNKTILIIEDNTEIRENTCELLELEGYKVIFAVNGKTGLALAKEKKPDIILCDIWMPVSDGYEVFNELIKDVETANIPFIFLTASVEKSEIAAGFAMGAKGYIRKPFETKELLDTVAHVLLKHKN